jgi:hypothetical protein
MALASQALALASAPFQDKAGWQPGHVEVDAPIHHWETVDGFRNLRRCQHPGHPGNVGRADGRRWRATRWRYDCIGVDLALKVGKAAPHKQGRRFWPDSARGNRF